MPSARLFNLQNFPQYVRCKILKLTCFGYFVDIELHVFTKRPYFQKRFKHFPRDLRSFFWRHCEKEVNEKSDNP